MSRLAATAAIKEVLRNIGVLRFRGEMPPSMRRIYAAVSALENAGMRGDGFDGRARPDASSAFCRLRYF
jgi:hypothetical protein